MDALIPILPFHSQEGFEIQILGGRIVLVGAADAARFWSNVEIAAAEDCWPWKLSRRKTRSGESSYGQCWMVKGLAYAHRTAYQLANGPIPEGMHALHHCDNPPCCNPAHVFLGTAAVNALDKVSKGRQRKGARVPQSKLSAEAVAEIRKLAGTASQQALAERFGVSQGNIHSILSGKTWRHTTLVTGAGRIKLKAAWERATGEAPAEGRNLSSQAAADQAKAEVAP